MFLLLPIIAIWLLLAVCGLSACILAGRSDRAFEQLYPQRINPRNCALVQRVRFEAVGRNLATTLFEPVVQLYGEQVGDARRYLALRCAHRAGSAVSHRWCLTPALGSARRAVKSWQPIKK